MNDKLLEIQKKLKAPKSERNNFAQFNYRSAEDIFKAVKPLVHGQGCTLIVTDKVVTVGQSNYVKSTAILSDGDKSVEATAYAREELVKKGMDTAQITGSTSSYARKYALSGLFAIDDSAQDPDSKDNTKPVEQPKPAAKPVEQEAPSKIVTAVQKLQLRKDMQNAGIANEELADYIESVLDKRTVNTPEELKKVYEALELMS